MLIVNGKSHFCNDTFTDVWFTSLLAKNKRILKKNIKYFRLLESAFHSLFFLKFSFKSLSKSYAKKQQWVFFSEHSVHLNVYLVSRYNFIV